MEEAGKEEGLLEQHQAMTWEDQSSPSALDFHICEMGSWSPVHVPFASPHVSVLTWRILVWICKPELNPCFISWGSVTSSTSSDPAPLLVTLIDNILCSWWAKWGAITSVFHLILSPCLWAIRYHYPHFTDEKIFSTAWMINHCNTLAHNRKDATSQAIKYWALSYAQEVLTPNYAFAIHHSHSSKEKGINMSQLCSHRAHVWVENWESKVSAECWKLSNTCVPMHSLPTSIPSLSTCYSQGSLVIW